MNTKTVILTGGMGFVAAHVIEHILLNTNWNIVSIDRLDTSGNPNRLTDMECWEKEKYRLKIIHWDLKAEISSQVTEMIGHFDYLIHIAASSHVDRSISDPMSFVYDNVVGTGNILEFFRKHVTELKIASNDANFPVTLPRMLYFSTDEVFGPIEEGTHKEDQRHAPGNPYSASKAAAEDLCLAYANTYMLPIVITNTMNIIGERQHSEKYVPLVIKRVLADETVQIHATPDLKKSGIRFYLHARNAAAAVLFILQQTTENIAVKHPSQGRFNIVGEREMDNLALAEMIARIIGKPLKYELINFHQSRPGHDLRYGLDGSKLKSLGFEFPTAFEDSLIKTVEWTMANPRWL